VYWRRGIERLVEGEARILIHDGQVRPEALKKELMTERDLLSAVRREGLERFEDVHLAVAEPNGMISIIPRVRAGSGSAS
jgi:uncharacterized membrane protein YcaP (DUF421 family)